LLYKSRLIRITHSIATDPEHHEKVPADVLDQLGTSLVDPPRNSRLTEGIAGPAVRPEDKT
jgi:hypothetical protein